MGEAFTAMDMRDTARMLRQIGIHIESLVFTLRTLRVKETCDSSREAKGLLKLKTTLQYELVDTSAKQYTRLKREKLLALSSEQTV